MAEQAFADDDDHRRRAEERDFLREVELAQEQLERNTRTFVDVLVEAMETGEQVTVTVGPFSFTGQVVGVSDTLLRLIDGGGEVDVNLDLMSELRLRITSGITPIGGGPVPSLLGRLRELAGSAGDALARLGTMAGSEIRGEVEAAAADHVEVRDQTGALVILRVSGVSWIRSSE